MNSMIRMFLFSVVFSLITAGPALAQYDNVWIFGNSAGIDFNSGSPVPVVSGIRGLNLEANASISNERGELLFYTNGTTVWNRRHRAMPNGSVIVPQPVFADPTTSSSQGAVIVPVPEDPGKYYVFSKISAQMEYETGRLYYSIVDMSLDNGWGDVVAAQAGRLLDSNLGEHMGLVAGANCNYWLVNITMDRTAAMFRSYEINASGIAAQAVVSPALIGTESLSQPKHSTGFIVFSHRWDRLCVTNVYGSHMGAALYDFDFSTGRISNPLQLGQELNARGYGASFSPDDSKLYLNLGMELFQYDLTLQDEAEIRASRTGVGSARSLTQLKLGPDGQLYFQSGVSINSVDEVGKIQYPDRKGAACGYVSEAFRLHQGSSMHLCFSAPALYVRRDTFRRSVHISPSCFYAPVELRTSGSGGTDYMWHDGSRQPSFTADTSGVYYVSYFTPPCNYHEDTFYLTYPPDPVPLPDLSIDTACYGKADGIAFLRSDPAYGGGFTYAWISPSGDTLSVSDTLRNAASGNYTVYIRAGNGCDTLMEFYMPGYTDRVKFGLGDSLICLGEVLSAENLSDPGFSAFEWDFGDGRRSQEYAPEHAYVAAGRYEVTLYGSGSRCRDTFRRMVTVDAPVAPLGFRADRSELCAGNPVAFSGIWPAGDGRVRLVSWDPGTGTNSPVAAPGWSHSYSEAGIYNPGLHIAFRVCPDTVLRERIEVLPVPEVDLGPDTGICLRSASLQLRNLSVAEAGRYLWEPGGFTGREMDVRSYGTYILSVVNQQGCGGRDTIAIRNTCEIGIPNVFSPNGDGYNDYFFPEGIGSMPVRSFRMQVFNRWGQQIYTTASVSGPGWDGSLSGHPQPAGVYVYLIEVDFADLGLQHYQGNITLIR